jgi:hypothetical protein
MAKTQRNLTDISGTIDTTGVQPGITDNIAFVHEIFETKPKTREEILAEEAKLQEQVAENKSQQLKDAVIGHSANLAGGDILHILEAQYGISLADLKADQGRKTLTKRSFGGAPVAEAVVADVSVDTPEPVVVAETPVAETVVEEVTDVPTDATVDAVEVPTEEATTTGEGISLAKKATRKRAAKKTTKE